jgi:hypothetical protein
LLVRWPFFFWPALKYMWGPVLLFTGGGGPPSLNQAN